MKWNLLAAAVAIGLTARGCSINTAGIETTNGATVTASVSSITGNAPPFSRVSVFDSGYIPAVDSGTALVTLAGDTGGFGFEGIAPGAYTVIIETPDSKKAALFQDIPVGPRAVDSVRHQTLESTGVLSGTVTTAMGPAGILVYLAGTGYYQVLSGSGQFTFSDIAPGVYTLQAIGLANNAKYATPTLVSAQDRKTIEVLAGKVNHADTLRVQ